MENFKSGLSKILLTFLALMLSTALAAEGVVVVPLGGGQEIGGVTTRTTTFTFPGLNNGSGLYLDGFALCAANESVMGGGYGLSNRVSSGSQPNVIVIESRPSDSSGDPVANGGTARGWYVDARQNSTSIATTVTVYVQCLATN